jgi:hypothetical protein
MRTLQKLLCTAWGKDKIQFLSAYPKQTEANNLVPPIITYSIVSKTPGAFGPSNTIERKQRFRETITVNEKGKEIPVELMGQVFDYKVSFEIWADNGDSADELAERFQLFISQYTGYLKKVGVLEILFERMEGESEGTQWKTDLIKRRIVYHIRLDEVSGIKCPSIEEIVIKTLMHDNAYDMLLNLYLLDEDKSREVLYEDQSTIN